ncbi:MAG TPA: response regulator [Anaerolineales bacterium]|nr:response regulator [Anaerolineales bacterium]
MASTGERILIVESDPDISDLIGRQALQPLGYQLTLTGEAGAAIKSAVQNPPDLILANLNLPGLSGKDLITALMSQGISAPLIVIAEKGQEQSVIQSFRLGAVDAILWPARDAEVVRVVERALQQTHETRARVQLDRQLEAANQELQHTVRELTAILAIGKAVTSTTDTRRLFSQIVEGAMQVAESETSWLMIRDENTRTFLLTAHRNLPESWAKKINQPLDDGISSLVAVSAETLSIHGAPLEKFKVAALGKSAAVVPIKVQNEVIGLLIVVRKAESEINKVAQSLLEAVADYASISLVNARLFRVVQQNVEAARMNEKHRLAMLESLKESIREEMQVSMYPLEALLSGKPGALTAEQEQALKTIQSSLQRLSRSGEKTVAPDAAKKGNG